MSDLATLCTNPELVSGFAHLRLDQFDSTISTVSVCPLCSMQLRCTKRGWNIRLFWFLFSGSDNTP